MLDEIHRRLTKVSDNDVQARLAFRVKQLQDSFDEELKKFRDINNGVKEQLERDTQALKAEMAAADEELQAQVSTFEVISPLK